ncbi:MAG: dUTP diphosphatase [Promethearchaeia archaeon]
MIEQQKEKKKSRSKISIPFKKLRDGVEVPKFAQPGDAGKNLMDVDSETYTLEPLERIGCPLGFSTAIPEGYYFKVVPRSGLALWQGISVVNSPGTIDSGYRNEWMAIVVNLSNKNVILKKGERICQLILGKLHPYEFQETEILPTSERGLGGFGSTGKD